MTEDDYWERVRDMRKDDKANHDPRLYDTHITPHDQFLVIGAVRYARGRATYIVGMTVDWVINHWDDLTENTRYVIARDVAEECDYRQRTHNQRTILSQIDDTDWNRLWNHIKENTNDQPNP